MKIQIESGSPGSAPAAPVVLHLEGRLLMGPACSEFETVVSQLLSQGTPRLVFDLSQVTHIDSTGMGRFIDTYNRLQPSGGWMGLAGATGGVREMFRVTRLDTIFPFYDSVADATRAS